MSKSDFKNYQITLLSSEYVKIRSWLFRNEPNSPTISEINQAVEHSYSPQPFGFKFSEVALIDIKRVFFILAKEQIKLKK